MKHYAKAKTDGTNLGNIYTVKFGKLTCYECPIHGEDCPIIVFDSKGDDITDEFDAYDMETIKHVAEL